MANEYTDLATLKLALKVTDTDRDDLLSAALSAASRGIDQMTGRRFYLDASATARTYTLAERTVVDEAGERLLVDDIGDEASLTVETGSGGAFTTLDDYETAPDNALAGGRPITSLRRVTGSWGAGATRVRVTARWGWPAVPDEVVQATLIQAARLFKRKDSPEGVTGSAEWGIVRLPRVDPDVHALIQHYIAGGFG